MATRVACEFESHDFRCGRGLGRRCLGCRRPIVLPKQLQPKLLQPSSVLWPSGEGSSLTRSGSGVRVPPGLLKHPEYASGRAARASGCLRLRRSGCPGGCRFNSCFGMRYAQVRQLAERSGLNPGVCRFESCSGYCRKTVKRLGRQLADHLGLEPGMLWVRLPPEPLATTNYVLVEQRSARLPVTQEIVGSNPIGDARPRWRGTQTGKAAKLKPS